MKKAAVWVSILVAGVAVAALIGWAATYTPVYSESASQAWSRGRIIGLTPVNLAVGMQPAPDGSVALTWVDLDNRLHVVQLGARGQVLADRMPGLDTGIPRSPRLVVDESGAIHLAWLETQGSTSGLRYARLSPTLAVESGPHALSLPWDMARSHQLVLTSPGNLQVFWIGEAGLYQLAIAGPGVGREEPRLLAERAEDLAASLDENGLIHLAWSEQPGPNSRLMWYAVFQPESGALSDPEEMGSLFLRGAQRIESLAVGVDGSSGYVVWIIQDMRDVDSRSWYATFPRELPRLSRIRTLPLRMGSSPLSLSGLRTPEGRFVLAMSQSVMTPAGPQVQIGILPMGPESPPDQEVWAALTVPAALPQTNPAVQLEAQYTVTASNTPSLRPTLTVDAQGEMHLAWLQTGGFGVYRVAYASTTPGVLASYNAVTLWDVADRVFSVAMRLFMVVGLMPALAIGWSLLPLMWLFGYHLVTGKEVLETTSARVALAVAIGLVLVMTYLIYPYRSSMPIALQWLAPPATAALSLLPMAAVLRRQADPSLFGGFFIFAIAHGFLQVALFVLLQW